MEPRTRERDGPKLSLSFDWDLHLNAAWSAD